MTTTDEDVVRQGYEAFGAGDTKRLGALMTDDVIHVIPGTNRFTGEHKGRDELMRMYGEMAELSGGTFRAELESVEDKGDGKVVSVHHGTGQREGRRLDTEETLTFTIHDGKITRLESSFSPADEAAEDTFWGTPN